MGTVFELIGWGAALEALLLVVCFLYMKLGPKEDGQAVWMGCGVFLTGSVLIPFLVPLVWFLSHHLGWH